MGRWPGRGPGATARAPDTALEGAWPVARASVRALWDRPPWQSSPDLRPTALAGPGMTPGGMQSEGGGGPWPVPASWVRGRRRPTACAANRVRDGCSWLPEARGSFCLPWSGATTRDPSPAWGREPEAGPPAQGHLRPRGESGYLTVTQAGSPRMATRQPKQARPLRSERRLGLRGSAGGGEGAGVGPPAPPPSAP